MSGRACFQAGRPAVGTALRKLVISSPGRCRNVQCFQVLAAGGAQEKLEHKVKQMLEEDPETRARLQAVDEAAAVVARLQEERANVDRLLSNAAASSRDNLDADQQAARDKLVRDVEEALNDLQAAQGELSSAARERGRLQALVDRGTDRLESTKAGVVAGLAGLLASLPFAIADNRGLQALAFTLASAVLSTALCGIVLRYAARENWNDGQLKQGVILAFGFTKGLAQAPMPHVSGLQDTGALFDFIYQTFLSVGSSTVVFGCAGAAVQAAVGSQWLKPCVRGADE